MASTLLVSDYDCTITREDTTHLCTKALKRFQEASGAKQAEMLRVYESRWNTFEVNLQEVVDKYLKQEKINMEDLVDLCTQISLERKLSRRRFADDKYFDHHLPDDVGSIIEEAVFHPYVREVFANCKQNENISCKVLTLNWYPKLVEKSLDGLVSPGEIFPAIYPFLENGDMIQAVVSSCFSKRDWIAKWKQEEFKHVIYIGDSLPDLLALLESDYGIIFGSNPRLLSIVERLANERVPLSTLIRNIKDGKKENAELKPLYQTSSWKEVEEFLLVIAKN